MFEGITYLERSRSRNIKTLIDVVGGDPRTFLRGASLAGVDLRGQDLRGISFDTADLTGVIADFQTTADSAELKRNLLVNTTRTYESLLKKGAYKDQRDRGRIQIELAAVALSAEMPDIAINTISEIGRDNLPYSLAPVIFEPALSLDKQVSRLIDMWLENFGFEDFALPTFMALSNFVFSADWVPTALTWATSEIGERKSIKLVRSISKGPNRKAFIGEIERRLNDNGKRAKYIFDWSIKHYYVDKDIFSTALEGGLRIGLQRHIPIENKVEIFSNYILIDEGRNAKDTFLHYQDKEKRSYWTAAFLNSLSHIKTESHLNSARQLAKVLNINLPSHVDVSSSSALKLARDAAVSQLRRLEPNFAARVVRAGTFTDNKKTIAAIKLPERASLYVATIDVLKAIGGTGTNKQIERLVAESLELSPATLEIPQGRDHRTKFQYELAWVRTYLQWGGAIVNVGRGTWRVTDLGSEMSETDLRQLWKRVAAERRDTKMLPSSAL